MRYKATGGRPPQQILNVEQLNRFTDGERITIERLAEARLIDDADCDVKLLGDGALTKRLAVIVHAASRSAKAKVAGAGGTIEFIENSPPAQGSRLGAQGTSAQSRAQSPEPRV